MKRIGSLVLVLVMVLSAVSAMAALPEGYVYEPWRGDKGGVISAEISRLNDQGVADTVAIQALPPKWQDKPNNNGTVRGVSYTWYLWALEGRGVDASIVKALELLAEYGIDGRAATRRILDELNMTWDQFLAFIDDSYVGGLNGMDETVYVKIASVKAYLKAIADAIPTGSFADPIRAWNDTTKSTQHIGSYYRVGSDRNERWIYVTDTGITGSTSRAGLSMVVQSDPTQTGDAMFSSTVGLEFSVYYKGTVYVWGGIGIGYVPVA